MGTWRFNILVVLFWGAATTWLVHDKVMPQWKRGNPPPYLAPDAPDSMVCWSIEFVAGDQDPSKPPQRLGWAASRVLPRSAGREIQTRVQLLRVPPSIFEPWMRPFLRLTPLDLDRAELGLTISIHLDNESRLTRFVSKGFIGDGPPLCTVTGVNNDGELEVSRRLGKQEPQVVGTYWLGEESALNDSHAPHDRLPELTVGQTWKSQQFSPLKIGGRGDVTSEALEAEVMRVEEIIWNGRIASCWLVEFHRDSGAGSRWAETPLRQMWVRVKDGLVLREDIVVLGRKLRFSRLPPEKAQRLAGVLMQDWSAQVREDVLSGADKNEASTSRPASQPTSATSHRPHRNKHPAAA